MRAQMAIEAARKEELGL
ncbi:hypothetical protein OBG91_07435 [Lactococcus lactis]|nr:hypothetical protein [Lactococcus lactis]